MTLVGSKPLAKVIINEMTTVASAGRARSSERHRADSNTELEFLIWLG